MTSDHTTGTAVDCAVCGEERSRPWLWPARSPGPVVRCTFCGLVYVSPRERTGSIIFEGADLPNREALKDQDDPNLLIGSWEAAHLERFLPEREHLSAGHQRMLARIAEHRPPPGELLDFGCGWGFFLEDARAAGWTVQGLEPLPGHGVYARGRLGLPVVTDTLHEDTFAEDRFDVVTAFQVFEHLPDPAAELVKIRRILRDDGLLVVEVPNIATPAVHVLRGRHRHFVEDHLWFFSPRTLPALFVRAGFEVLETSFPTRTLSLRYLASAWLPRYLPAFVARRLQGLAQRSFLAERTVRVNLGDILLVVARKVSGAAWHDAPLESQV